MRKFQYLFAVLLTVTFLLICIHIYVTNVIKSNQIVSSNTNIRAKFVTRNSQINCANVIEGNSDDQTKALQFNEPQPGFHLTDNELNLAIDDCSSFLSNRGFITNFNNISHEERNFPLAFSILIHQDIGQMERLLRAIYRPQNYYCVHVDAKMSRHDLQLIKKLLECLPGGNAILSSKRIDVVWGKYSLLEADLSCLEELWRRFKKWKYLLNLTGQEFPLRTNRELVSILKAYNGANNLEGTVLHRNSERVPKENPDFKVVWTKGSVHITSSRGFVDFLINNSRSRKILKILERNDRYSRTVPDEQFYATINHNPDTLPAPGAFTMNPEAIIDGKIIDYPFLTRLKNWGSMPCESGKRVRSICIWGVKDLPFIVRRPELFINKLYWNFQSAALDCLEEHYWNRTYLEMANHAPVFNLTYYKSLIFVKNHL